MSSYSEKFLVEIIEAWQPDYQEPLTREDAREIVETSLASSRRLWSGSAGTGSGLNRART